MAGLAIIAKRMRPAAPADRFATAMDCRRQRPANHPRRRVRHRATTPSHDFPSHPVRTGPAEEDPWPITSKPENIAIVVAGGTHPTHAFWLQTSIAKQLTSAAITLPQAWERLHHDRDHLARIQDEDAVGVSDRAQSVGDDERSPAAHQVGQGQGGSKDPFPGEGQPGGRIAAPAS